LPSWHQDKQGPNIEGPNIEGPNIAIGKGIQIGMEMDISISMGMGMGMGMGKNLARLHSKIRTIPDKPPILFVVAPEDST
jgi:hypothetical protein